MRGSEIRLRAAFVVIGVIVAAFLFAYPTQSLLAQQRDVNTRRAQDDSLRKENRELQVQINRLQLPSEIERVARERYNMVRPNEQAFTIVPAERRVPATTAGSATK